MFKHLSKTILSLLIIFFLIGCSKDNEQRIIFVLFDLSGSTKLKEIRQKYLDEFKKVVNSLNPKDRIIADNITDSPLAQSSFPINMECKSFNPIEDNKIEYEKKIDQQKKKILEHAKRILFDFERRVPSTKIVEASQLAERVFNTYKLSKKVFVIFSDMVEESERYDFRNVRLTENKIQQIIQYYRNQQILPDLSGVVVYVVGAISGSYEKMSSTRIMQIRNFWLQYFQACGAELTKERYGGALLVFD